MMPNDTTLEPSHTSHILSPSLERPRLSQVQQGVIPTHLSPMDTRWLDNFKRLPCTRRKAPSHTKQRIQAQYRQQDTTDLRRMELVLDITVVQVKVAKSNDWDTLLSRIQSLGTFRITFGAARILSLHKFARSMTR